MNNKNFAKLVAIASFALLAGSLASCSQSEIAVPTDDKQWGTKNEHNAEDYNLGSIYGAKIKSENTQYTNSSLKELCFSEYSNLPRSEKYHSDGSLVSEKEFVDACYVNGVK